MSDSRRKRQSQISAESVKQAAAGKWLEILADAGIPAELLDGRGHPCPKCNAGTDRFCAFPDVDQTGGVMCRHCFDRKNGDGLAAVQWIRGISFPESIEWVAERIRLAGDGRCRSTPGIVEAVAWAKGIPLDAFQQFGVQAAKRGKCQVARVPVYDPKGEVHSYFDLTPDGKGWFKRGKGNSGLFFPGRLPVPGETWVLVEGVKDAAALTGLGFSAAGLPTNEMNARFARLFVGCHIVVLPDLDEAGMRGAHRTSGRLADIAASVRIARLPGEVVQNGGDDVRDVLVRQGDEPVRMAIEDAAAWVPSDGGSSDERPEILISLDEATVATNVVQNLASLGWKSPWLAADEAERARLFQRGGVLVHVVCDDEAEASGITLPEAVPQIRTLPKALVRERITQAVRLVAEEERSEDIVLVRKRPADWLVSAIHQRGEFGAIRKLSGITRTPTLRPDGTVLQTPGYDARTGLLLMPDCVFPDVPEAPSRDDAVRAASRLLSIVEDFPFGSDAHRSIWVACVLTLLARPAIDGPAPLFAFDGNTRGAGKTLLADVAGIIAHGSPMARKAWPGKDEEVRKTITAVALEGWASILFDNVASMLGGASLDAALTGTTWQDRVLGESRTTGILPLTTLWLASGNNIELTEDTGRRVLMARLETLEEHPEDRTDFRHRDLKAFARKERPRLAVAGLTMLRAWFEAGCPEMPIPAWGSFEAWSRTVRHCMVWAGLADPWQTRDATRDSDQSAQLVRLIHSGIEEADLEENGLTSADIERLLSHPVTPDATDQWPTLRIAMAELCGSKPTSRKIGCGLRKYRGRVCAGKRLSCRDGHGGVKRWFVERVENELQVAAPAGGDGGDASRSMAGESGIHAPVSGGDGGHGGDDQCCPGQNAEVITYEL